METNNLNRKSNYWTRMRTSAPMREITDHLNKILGEGVVEYKGTTLIVNLEKEIDSERFLELELKENIILNVLYNWKNWEILSENIGFTITAEDYVYGEIDLKGFVN